MSKTKNHVSTTAHADKVPEGPATIAVPASLPGCFSCLLTKYCCWPRGARHYWTTIYVASSPAELVHALS